MWFYMVNHRSLNVLSVPLTNLTQRMFSKINFAFLPPLAVIASLGCRACNFRMERYMFLAVSSVSEFRTAGMSARFLWSVWHSLSFPRKKGRSIRNALVSYSSLAIITIPHLKVVIKRNSGGY